MKRLLSISIILLFIGLSISSSTGLNTNLSFQPLLSGNTLYVGGNGTGNYSKIQDAIDNASAYDTVFVYDDSSPYYENLIVDKSINLIGENRETTVIDGSGIKSVISVCYPEVLISDFTIQNSGTDNENHSGIEISYNYTDEICIKNNIIKSNNNGIFLFCSHLCLIQNNIITSNENGISGGGWRMVGHSVGNTITKNVISNNNRFGIDGYYYFNCNNISNNIINNNSYGIGFGDNCYENKCIRNNISKNKIGILSTPSGNIIKKNNFIRNIRHAKQHMTLLFNLIDEEFTDCTFDGNYWGKKRNLPFPIPKKFGFIFSTFHAFPILDWHPAQEPYDIEV